VVKQGMAQLAKTIIKEETRARQDLKPREMQAWMVKDHDCRVNGLIGSLKQSMDWESTRGLLKTKEYRGYTQWYI